MKTKYYGFNANGKPVFFPTGTRGAGYPYVMIERGGKWFTLPKDGPEEPCGDESDHKDYVRFAKDKAWIAFRGNPFRTKVKTFARH
jgi:hypothetical protein